MDLDRRTLLASGAAGATTLLVGGTAEAAPSVGKTLAKDLVVPWGLAFLPSGDALVAERRTGQVFRVRRTGGRRLIGEVAGAVDFGEGGLLGLAVAPTFRTDRWVYAYFTSGSDNRIVRMRYEAGKLGPRRLLLAGIPRDSIHNGGRLRFSPGGLLYASAGDADQPQQAQNLGYLGGKILRMTPDGEVPSTNPFPGSYVWTLGHRNPQGLAFDARGRLWAAELGQSTRDELNRIRKGRNYGWPDVEGGDGSGPFADPLTTWTTAECSPSGVAVARGRAWVGALRGQALWSVKLNGPNAGRKTRHFHTAFGRIRTVERAPDGSLWITTSNRDGRATPGPADDRVIRIRL